ncbi:MAG TPA: CbiX/SirB N-terminal domain-containing protein [Mycobacteriales bacterium]|nr:CbiX/SirB N-terminal domain-containing protein [Mycobacteriales bacterium]
MSASRPAANPGPRVGLLVVGHGSRRAAANEVLVAVAAEVAGRSTGLQAVSHAFLEIARPTIAEGYAELVAAGCEHVVVHPYFLYPGNHTTTDIPGALAVAQAAAPAVGWTMSEPLGVDPRIVDVVLERVAGALPVPSAAADGGTQ